MGEDQSLQRLHQVGHQGNQRVAVGLLVAQCLWHWDSAGCLPELWYSSQLQLQVKRVTWNPSQLVCAGLQESGEDAPWTCRFPSPSPLAILTCCAVRDRPEQGGVDGGRGTGQGAN